MKLFTAPPLSHLSPPAAGEMPRERKIACLPSAPSQLRLMPIARLAQGGRWRVEAMRALSEPCLLWFTRGQGRITVGGTTRGYGAHNAIFIPAGVMHGFDMSPQTHGTAVFFGTECNLPLPQGALHLRIRDAASQVELNALLEAAQRESESDRPAADRAVHHHLGLLSVWLERQAASGANDLPAPDAARKLVARYATLLEREFRSGHGVADYAAQLGVTPTHLTRSCRSSCGRAASDLLQDRRLYEARRLLSETRAPVKEISEVLGYTSPAYFTRAFHARTGKTPSQFRKAP